MTSRIPTGHHAGGSGRWPLAAMAAGAIAFLLAGCGKSPEASVSGGPSGETTPSGDDTSLEALEQRLREAGASEDPDQKQMIVDEVAQALVRFHGAEGADGPLEPEEPDYDRTKPREYDLEKLIGDFAENLENPDRELRRASFREFAEILGRAGDVDVATGFVREILRGPTEFANADAYAFVSTFSEYLSGSENRKALAAWAGILPGTMQQVAYQSAARTWPFEELGALTEVMKASDDPAVRSSIIRTLDFRLLEADPEVSAAWARDLAANPEDGPRHSDVVAKHWARGDIEGSTEWVASLANTEDQTRAYRELVTGMVNRDPASAGDWASALADGPVKDDALAVTVSVWAAKDAKAAAAFAEETQNAVVLEMTMPSIAAKWAEKDADAAAAWVQSLDNVRPDLKDYVLTLMDRPAVSSSTGS